jgi:hypothetical protein
MQSYELSVDLHQSNNGFSGCCNMTDFVGWFGMELFCFVWVTFFCGLLV